jgi:hypothetical protein
MVGLSPRRTFVDQDDMQPPSVTHAGTGCKRWVDLVTRDARHMVVELCASGSYEPRPQTLHLRRWP